MKFLAWCMKKLGVLDLSRRLAALEADGRLLSIEKRLAAIESERGWLLGRVDTANSLSINLGTKYDKLAEALGMLVMVGLDGEAEIVKINEPETLKAIREYVDAVTSVNLFLARSMDQAAHKLRRSSGRVA